MLQQKPSKQYRHTANRLTPGSEQEDFIVHNESNATDNDNAFPERLMAEAIDQACILADDQSNQSGMPIIDYHIYNGN